MDKVYRADVKNHGRQMAIKLLSDISATIRKGWLTSNVKLKQWIRGMGDEYQQIAVDCWSDYFDG